MFTRKMMCVTIGLLLVTGTALSGWDFPWKDPIKKVKQLEEKKEYTQAAEECWKLIKNDGNEDAYIELQKLAKYALNTRQNNMIAAAKKLAEKRGITLKNYDGNAFILVQDEDDLIEKIYKYYNSFFKSNKTVLLQCMQAAYPTRIFIGPRTGTPYKVKSFSDDGSSIPFLTLDIYNKEFQDNKTFTHNGEMELYFKFIDGDYQHKLVHSDVFSREVYRAKINAFINLCQHYGAKYLKMTRLESSDKTIEFDLQGNIKTSPESENKIKSSAVIGKKYKEIFNCKYEFSGKKASGAPPKSPWLNNDFKVFCQRLESNNELKKAEVTLEYTEDVGISMALVSKLNRFGVNIGDLATKIKGGKTEKYYCTYTVYFSDEMYQSDLKKNKH